MVRIRKRSEPACLTAERAANRRFDDIDGECKQSMRKALVGEQRELCCYCMCRISAGATTMVIEHLVAQSDPTRGQQLAMDWQNLFGSCTGGRRGPVSSHHCDASKQDTPLSFVLTDANIESKIRYLGNGEIGSPDPTLDRELKQVLCLNVAHLPNNRSAALEGFLAYCTRRAPGAWTTEKIDKFINEVTTPTVSEPFIGIVLYQLKKRRSRC